MDNSNETSTEGYPKSTNGFAGNTNARSKLELMRKQFVSKQAVRTAQARQVRSYEWRMVNSHHVQVKL